MAAVPMRTLSRANSMWSMLTVSASSMAAFSAAWLTMFSRSAPVKPVVPWASWLTSTAGNGKETYYLTMHSAHFIYGYMEGNVLFNDALNTFYVWLYGVGHMVKDHSDSQRKEMFYLMMHSTHFIYGYMEGNVLFNDALNTFYVRLYGVGHMVKDHSDSERKEMFYLMTHSTHFIYSYMVSDIW